MPARPPSIGASSTPSSCRSSPSTAAIVSRFRRYRAAPSFCRRRHSKSRRRCPPFMPPMARNAFSATCAPGRSPCAAQKPGRFCRSISRQSICITIGDTMSFGRSPVHCPTIFRNTGRSTLSLDKTRMTGRLPWGQEIPLRPFSGSWRWRRRRLGQDTDPAAAPQRRQSRQQGACRRHNFVSSHFHRRCAFLRGRWAWRAGRWRSLRHRDRDRAGRHLSSHRPRRYAARMAAWPRRPRT